MSTGKTFAAIGNGSSIACTLHFNIHFSVGKTSPEEIWSRSPYTKRTFIDILDGCVQLINLCTIDILQNDSIPTHSFNTFVTIPLRPNANVIARFA